MTSERSSRPGSSAEGDLDVVVLVPDADWEQAVSALLSRPCALGIRGLSFQVVRHPQRDPGVRTAAAGLLRPFQGRARFALVCLDLEGSGHPGPPEDLAQGIEEMLKPEWGDRCAAVVVDPELERWIWADSPHVARSLGWQGTMGELRTELEGRGRWPASAQKPLRPKETMREVMRSTGRPVSAAVFRGIAERVSLQGCTDPAFHRFREVLRAWFPAPAGGA